MNPFVFNEFFVIWVKRPSFGRRTHNKGRQANDTTDVLLYRKQRYARTRHTYPFRSRCARHPLAASSLNPNRPLCAIVVVISSATRSRLTACTHSFLWVYLNGIALRLRQYSVNNHTIYNAKTQCFIPYHTITTAPSQSTPKKKFNYIIKTIGIYCFTPVDRTKKWSICIASD